MLDASPIDARWVRFAKIANSHSLGRFVWPKSLSVAALSVAFVSSKRIAPSSIEITVPLDQHHMFCFCSHQGKGCDDYAISVYICGALLRSASRLKNLTRHACR